MSRRNEGHLPIIPIRHVADCFSVTADGHEHEHGFAPKTRGIPLIHLGACAA